MEGDLDYDPEEDWLDDNKGKPNMEFPDFFDAMFELADVWCDQISAQDYAALLTELLADAKSQHKSFQVWVLILKFTMQSKHGMTFHTTLLFAQPFEEVWQQNSSAAAGGTISPFHAEHDTFAEGAQPFLIHLIELREFVKLLKSTGRTYTMGYGTRILALAWI